MNAGGSWGVRISGTPTHDGPSRISVIYHFGLEGDGTIDLVNELDGEVCIVKIYNDA